MKQKPRSPHKRKTPKTHLRLPDLEFSKTAVLNSLTSRDGQRGYSAQTNTGPTQIVTREPGCVLWSREA